MHAIGETLSGERRDRGSDRLEFTFQAGPAVDNQEDIAEPVAQWIPLDHELSIVRDRFDPVVAEEQFTRTDECGEPSDHAAVQLRIGTSGDRTDVGQSRRDANIPPPKSRQ